MSTSTDGTEFSKEQAKPINMASPASSRRSRLVVVNEDIVRKISEARGEPQFMLDFRLKAYDATDKCRSPNGQRSNIQQLITNISILFGAQTGQ